MKKSKDDIIDLGYQAYHRNESILDNPYFEDCIEADWWLLGYNQAKDRY